MYALAQAYLTGREIGECEAYYKLEPSLHYKQSNIRTIFISSGFPENRSQFMRKCQTDQEANNIKAFPVDDHEGKFILTESIHVKYSGRPNCIEEICLTQFTMRYTVVSPQTKKKIMESGRIPTSPTPEQGYKGTLTIVTGNDEDTLDLKDFIVLHNGSVMTLRRYDAVIRRHKFDYRKDPHEYYYSELLLFHPWRNESELFPDDFEKCQELYKSQQQNIQTVKYKLFPHLFEVELGRAMVEAFEENTKIGTEIDPEGEQENDPEQIAEIAEEYGGLDPEGLVEQNQFGEETVAGPSYFRTPPVLEMDDLKERTRILAWEQVCVLKRILEYLKDMVMSKNGKVAPKVQPPNIIVFGGAGCGKSKLIEIISHWVQKLMITGGDDVDCPYILRLAPTGMAASNIEGQTLHTALKMSFGNKYESLSDKSRDIIRDKYKNVKVIIIDEFSMMKSDQLYYIHLCLQEIMQNDSVFGGISLLLLGDPMQLKPIQGSYTFEPPKQENLKNIYEILNLWELFEVYQLIQNHRQGEDKEYADFLNRIRFKEKNEDFSDSDKTIIQTMIREPEDISKTLQIYGKKVTVNYINEQKLQTLTTKLHIIEAIHCGSKKNLTIQPDGTIENTAFLQLLKLKIRSRVMLIFNINTSDGLTNGAQGEVVNIISTNNKPLYIMVRFYNPKVGYEQRRKLQ